MNNKTLITKLNQIKKLTEECLENIAIEPILNHRLVTTKKKKNDTTTDHILLIVNKIKNCDESNQIEKKILDKDALHGRILLSFYICYKYFPEIGLKTSDIQKITSEFRMRIQTPNVSKTISSSLNKYLEGNSTRMKGKPVIYKLNRKGAKYFKLLLNPNEKK